MHPLPYTVNPACNLDVFLVRYPSRPITIKEVHMNTDPTTPAADASTAELIERMSEQVSRLVRDELQLARAELTYKGKKAGLGVGLFGGAGIIALYGVGCLVAAAILGLATGVPYWLAALIVAMALFAIAGAAVIFGRREVQEATPPVPTETVEGVKHDIEALKGHRPTAGETSSSTDPGSIDVTSRSNEPS
jgi:uncharacterized membrane protein YqjE